MKPAADTAGNVFLLALINLNSLSLLPALKLTKGPKFALQSTHEGVVRGCRLLNFWER
jgi:hypothetical protein